MHCAIITLTFVLLAAPLVAYAQPTGKAYRIGYLGTFPPGAQNPFSDAFTQGLRDYGYVEGQNLTIETRLSEGNVTRLPALAADLVGLGVSLIVASGVPPSRAAKDATTRVPIVFVGVADPVGLGLVASLARTSRAWPVVEWDAFFAKQLDVAKEALPQIARVAILMNPTNPMHLLARPQVQAAAAKLRVQLEFLETRDADNLEGAFAAATRWHADLLWVFGDSLAFTYRARLAELALKHRLPTMHFFGEAVEAGGLLGLGPSWPHIWRGVGRYVDKILKGTKPADIPVEQPTKYELTINLKTARVLGVTIPPALLLRAERVFE